MEPTISTDSNVETSPAIDDSAKKLTMIIYALYAVSPFLGFTMIAAIVMNYVKKDDVAGTFLASHFRWQMRTFWFWLMWMMLGVMTLVFVIGIFVLVASGIWFIYRIVKGGLRLSENKPMYA